MTRSDWRWHKPTAKRARDKTASREQTPTAAKRSPSVRKRPARDGATKRAGGVSLSPALSNSRIANTGETTRPSWPADSKSFGLPVSARLYRPPTSSADLARHPDCAAAIRRNRRYARKHRGGRSRRRRYPPGLHKRHHASAPRPPKKGYGGRQR